MRLIRTTLAVLALAGLVWSPAAFAKQYAPPGKAGSSEYAEDIPTAGGNAPTPAMGGSNKTSAQINRLGAGKAGVRKLSKLGTTGIAAAQFAQQTAPTTTSAASAPTTTSATSHRVSRAGTSHQRHVPVTAVSRTAFTASGGSALTALTHLADGSDAGGLGVILPLLLAFGLGWSAAAGFRKARRRPDAGAAES